MIQLYKFPGNEKLESSSPFCLRVELYMKLNNIAYTTITLTNPSIAPKGKLPYIIHDENTICDSSFIMDYLETKFPIVIEHGFDKISSAIGHTIEIMCNENLYWSLVYLRWISPENSPITCDNFFKSVPKLARNFVFKMVQKKVKQQIMGHGFGKHSAEEMNTLAIKDITALSNFLADKPYFFGDQISRVDITVYSYLANFLYSDLNSPIVNEIKTLDNLVRFTARILNLVETTKVQR